jgi:SAM-dependent methyltransferase
MPPNDERFGSEYFDRLYRTAETAVYTQAQVDALARGVTGMIEWWGYPLERVLDVGAGTAMWRDWLARERPDVRYVGVDVSEHACERYGHLKADIASWRDDRVEYDLIVCHGVFGYLDDEACEAAIHNLACMSRGFLFFHVSTQEDVERGVLDVERSDGTAIRRPARFYRDLLRDYYVPCGAGLWLIGTAPELLMELERA